VLRVDERGRVEPRDGFSAAAKPFKHQTQVVETVSRLWIDPYRSLEMVFGTVKLAPYGTWIGRT
jgi:hypothetical protein